MDSSKIFGGHGAEECQSSESGWTMYIGSPLDGELEDDDDGMMKNNVLYHEDYDDDDDDGDGSDDSMASDASSGPSHQQQPRDQSNGETGYHHGHGYGQVMAPTKYHQDDKKYSCSKKKSRKQEKKKKKETGVEGRNETKEECLFTEKRGIVTIQSGNKAWYLGQGK